MKKKIIGFASLGLMCATFFLSCETKNHAAEEQLEVALETPEKIISNVQAATLYQNDQQTRLSVLGKANTKFEDKVIHFELLALENYLRQIEALKTSENIPVTGINFVFGAEDNGQRTVFLMPSTRNSELDYHESFTIENGAFLPFKHVDITLELHKNSKNDNNLILSTEGFISYNEAVKLFNTYEAQYIRPFSKKVVKDYYTKAVWYSLVEIKEYVSFLKKKSTDYNLAISGINVLFGVYNSDPSLELKSNAQTIFFSASISKNTIINTSGKNFNDFLQQDFFSKNAEETNTESLNFNEGHLSPPPPKRKCYDDFGREIPC